MQVVISEISNKKINFIKRNFKQLSIEELACKTGLKPNVINPLINKYRAEIAERDQLNRIKDNVLSFPSWGTILLTSLLFSAVAIVIYFPSLRGDFVFDDRGTIMDNPFIHVTGVSQLLDILFSKEIDRRIGYVSFALNYYFGGLDTLGYHLVNVIIHTLNGIVLFLLSYTILTIPLDEKKGRGNALTIAFLGSFIWLVHPIQTQAVSYIVQRLTSLSALFFLLSLLFYMKGRVTHFPNRPLFFMLSLVFGRLALGTKQNTATLPLFIILSEFFFFHPEPFKMNRKKLGFLLLFGALFIFIAGIYLGPDFISRWALQYEERGWTPIERMMTELRVIIFYISLLIYPHPSRLNLDHDFSVSHSLFSPFTTFLSLLLIVGTLWLAFRFLNRDRLILYAILWFFGNLAIESSIVPLELVFEHRLYLPSMGLIMLFLGLCLSVLKKKWEKWITGFIILSILLFSYWTSERCSAWQGRFSIWTDAVKKSPHKARPHNNIGYTHAEEGRLDKAIEEFKCALAINPNYAEAHCNLGGAYFGKGMLDEATIECKKAIAINRNYIKAHLNLGSVYIKRGMIDEAINVYKMCLSVKSNNAKAYNNLGVAYGMKGKWDESIVKFKRALAINSNYAEAHHNLALEYLKKGFHSLAADHLYKAGVFHLEQGNINNALQAYQVMKRTKSEEHTRSLYKKLYLELK